MIDSDEFQATADKVSLPMKEVIVLLDGHVTQMIDASDTDGKRVRRYLPGTGVEPGAISFIISNGFSIYFNTQPVDLPPGWRWTTKEKAVDHLPEGIRHGFEKWELEFLLDFIALYRDGNFLYMLSGNNNVVMASADLVFIFTDEDEPGPTAH